MQYNLLSYIKQLFASINLRIYKIEKSIFHKLPFTVLMAEMIVLLFGLSGLLLLVTIGLYRPGIECKGKQNSCTIYTIYIQLKLFIIFPQTYTLRTYFFFFIVYKRPPPTTQIYKIVAKINAKIIML